MTERMLTLLMVNDYPDYIDPQEWKKALQARVPKLDFRLWPDGGDPADINIVLIDKGTPLGFFAGMTKLRAVAYLGAGIDGLQLGELPPAVGVVRLETRELASEVVQYILSACALLAAARYRIMLIPHSQNHTIY